MQSLSNFCSTAGVSPPQCLFLWGGRPPPGGRGALGNKGLWFSVTLGRQRETSREVPDFP